MGGRKSIPDVSLAAATWFAACEEGSIVTHNESINLGKPKTRQNNHVKLNFSADFVTSRQSLSKQLLTLMLSVQPHPF